MLPKYLQISEDLSAQRCENNWHWHCRDTEDTQIRKGAGIIVLDLKDFKDILVVMDAIVLYNNISPNEYVQCVEEKLKENPKQGVHPEFIASLFEIILEY